MVRFPARNQANSPPERRFRYHTIVAFYTSFKLDTPTADRLTIATAFHIKEFLESGYIKPASFPEDVRLLAIYLVDSGRHQPPPEVPLPGPESSSGSSRHRNKNQSTEFDKFRWPGVWQQWCVDGVALTRILKSFRQGTSHLPSQLGLSALSTSNSSPSTAGAATPLGSSPPTANPYAAASPSAAAMGPPSNKDKQGEYSEEQYGTDQGQGLNFMDDPRFKAALQHAVAEALKVTKDVKNVKEDLEENPSTGVEVTVRSAKHKSEDIGFFDPAAEGEGDMVNAGKYVVYKDVYEFKDRIDTLVQHWTEEEVRPLIPGCLRGDALKWHSNELTKDRKELLARMATCEEWMEALVKRFKLKTSTSLTRLHQLMYGVADARKGVLARQHANNVLKLTKSAEIASTKNQLNYLYNSFAYEFKQDLRAPINSTTIEEYLEDLDERQETWDERAQRGYRRPSPPPKPSRLQGRQQTMPFRSRDWPLQETTYQYKTPYYGTNATPQYTGQRPLQGQPQARPFLPPLQPPRPPLQITNGPTNPSSAPSQPRPQYMPPRPSYPPAQQPYYSGGYPPRQENRGGYPGSGYPNRPPPPAGPPMRPAAAYQADVGEEPPEQEVDADQQEAQGNYAEEEAYDEDYEAEPRQYFVAAMEESKPFICKICSEAFASNNRLHAHLGNTGYGRESATSSCPGRTVANAWKRQKEADSEEQDESKEAKSDVFSNNIRFDLSPSPEDASALLNEPAKETEEAIVDSTADSSRDIGTGQAYRHWRYARVEIQLTPRGTKSLVCADSGTSMTMLDKKLKDEAIPGATVRRMAVPARVRGIGNDVHETDEYIVQEIYFPGGKDKDGNKVTAKTARREIHLVDGLGAGMLIGNDVLVPEGIDLLFSKRVAQLGSCGVEVPMEVHAKGPIMRRVISAKKTTVIPPNATATVSIHHLDLPDRDFLFEPIEDSNLSLYAGMLDKNTTTIPVTNSMDKPVHIRRNMKLGDLTELAIDGCYHITSGQEDATELATRRPKEEHQSTYAKGFFKKLLQAGKTAAIAMLATGVNLASANQATTELSTGQVPPPNIAVTTSPEDVVLPNGVTTYGNVPELAQVVDEFPTVWKEEGFADLPEQEWMRIPLRSDWEDKAPKTARVYPLGADAKKVVDETFDKLHDQGRMSWTKESTPFSYPVFVVWTMRPDGTRKGRAVVDIRGLNAITQTDVYPLPLQADMISAVKGCLYITVVDCASFFYQWRTHPQDRHRTTVVTHRGQETFNVAVMGYKNSPAYVQRQIDRLLREHRHYARAYIDDVVIHSATLEEHVKHLRAIFGLFVKYNISINPKKAFLGYPSVKLLGQKVDSFGLSTDDEKLKAIASLNFPHTLASLEHYLGLTGWLRQFIPRYAFLAKPLQDRKTELLAKAPRSGQQRQDYSRKTRIENPTDKEWASFHAVQQALSKTCMLVHFDSKKVLFIDVDSSKAGGIGAMVYHVDGEIPGGKEYPQRKSIQPILFLSRLLKDAETRYWPTEMELAGVVWVLTKIRHMVDTAPKTIIYTDHGAALGIAKQTTLTTSSTDKLNLRLVRASDYIQRFQNVEFRYKMGSKHIIPDALSRLPQKNTELDYSTGQLDALWAHAYSTTVLVEMSSELKERILDGYKDDPDWTRLLEVLKNNDDAGEDAANLPFYRGTDGLIWRIDDVTSDHAFAPERLCVPNACVKDFFDTVHDKNGHIGRNKCHEIIARQWYIRGLDRRLREYLRHCPQCQLYQTPRHQPYGALQPILSPPAPYHTISMDFVLALPLTLEGYDCILTVTCKFSRKITLIPGKNTYSAEDWAGLLLTRLLLLDWGLPKAIISDRDRKFVSALWNEVFKRLGVSLLYSTAYHPQTDGSSERTNQTVEIALRFWIATLRHPELWPETLPMIQFRCNNALAQSLGATPTEVATGFTINDSLDLLGKEPMAIDPKIARIDAQDAIAWAQANSKFYYDRAHHPQFFREGDHALLRLHHGYDIPANDALGKKIGQQFTGPFRVVERIGRLAYRLDIPDFWKVHPVFTVAQLEPSPDPASDPFHRPRPTNPDAVNAEREDLPKEWEVTRVLDSRITGWGRQQYLLRWEGYGSHHDRWTNVEDMTADELIEEYEAHRGQIPERMTRRQRAAQRGPPQAQGASRQRPGRPRRVPQVLNDPEVQPRRQRGRPRKVKA